MSCPLTFGEFVLSLDFNKMESGGDARLLHLDPASRVPHCRKVFCNGSSLTDGKILYGPGHSCYYVFGDVERCLEHIP